MREVFLQSAHKQGNPSFHFMRRAQNADDRALKQPRLSQNISPVCSSFVLVIASDMHLESPSEKRAKNVYLHTAKSIQIQPTFFSLFLDKFVSIDLRPIYCSLISAADQLGESENYISSTRTWIT